MAEPTAVKVLLALEPRAVMAVMHTTMIRASMTAYSTAVGPSSLFRKADRREAMHFNMAGTSTLRLRDETWHDGPRAASRRCPARAGAGTQGPSPLQGHEQVEEVRAGRAGACPAEPTPPVRDDAPGQGVGR